MVFSKKTFLVGMVALLLLAAVLVIALTVKKNNQKNNLLGAQVSSSPQLSQLPKTGASISPTGLPLPTPQTITKIYSGQGFNLRYPATWGLLTCSNSANIEFDPESSADQKIVCNLATKPITILIVPSLSCQGEMFRIGNYPVIKSKLVSNQGEIVYRWCVNLGNKNLDITHRVSSFGTPASSKNDYSSQIQQIIFDVQVGSLGS